MKINEKIKLCRNQLSLSQEELAKKLLVSAETISQWENGNMSPTADELIRLKEVLGISIDTLLKDDNTPLIARETYTFTYSEEELTEIHKALLRNMLKRSVLAMVFFSLIVLLVIFTSGSSSAEGAFGVGAFVALLWMFIILWNVIKKKQKNSIPRITSGVYEYRLYDDYITMYTYRNQEETNRSKIELSQIESVQECGKYFLFVCNNLSHIVKKEVLNPQSALYEFLDKYPTKKIIKADKSKNKGNSTAIQTKPKKSREETIKVVSVILIVLSVLPLMLISKIAELVSSVIGYTSIEAMAGLFLFVPIPVVVIILGFITKNKKQKIINLVFGFIIAGLFCIFGSFSFIFSAPYSHEEDRVLNIEEYTGVDIPEYSQVDTLYWTDYTQSDTEGLPCVESTLYFTHKDVEDFEAQLANDENWIATIPNELIGTLSYRYNFYSYDYTMIYNADTKEFNTLPSESGTYECVNFFYDSQQNKMTIVEYDLVYTDGEVS